MSSGVVIARPKSYLPDRVIELGCCCGCNIVVVAEVFPEDDWDHEAYVEFFSRYRQGGWRERLKAAWLSLRGKGYFHDIVLEPEQLDALAEWLAGRKK